MSTLKQARHSQFKRGQGVYDCRCCGRATRDTGDNGQVELCEQCYDLAGEENSLSDSGEFYDTPARIVELVEFVKSKGGNVACWDSIYTRALSLIPADALAQAEKIHAQVTKTSTPADAGLDTTLYAAAIKFGKTIQSLDNRAVFNRVIDHAADNATHTILVEKAQPTDAWAYMFKGDCELLLGDAKVSDLNRKYIRAYFVKLNILN